MVLFQVFYEGWREKKGLLEGAESLLFYLKQLQCLLLFFTHVGFFFRRFIRITAKVEYAVDHHAMQLLLERHAKLQCIIPYPVNADKNITFDQRRFCVREGNDICVGIVVEVFLIEVIEILVAAKDIGGLM